MSVVRESDIEFDFSAAIQVVKHDAINRTFPGVDFIITEAARDVWLEVKNWEGSTVPANRRGGQRRSFLAKMRGKPFFTGELRGKFTGTVAYLCLTGNAPTRELLNVALLESPRMDSALMLRATERLRGLVKRDFLWQIPVNVVVFNLSEWNKQFPNYPAKAI